MVNMADYILSEILSFLNPAQKASGSFSVEQKCQTRSICSGLSPVHRKIGWNFGEITQSMRQRRIGLGPLLSVRVGVVVLLVTKPKI